MGYNDEGAAIYNRDVATDSAFADGDAVHHAVFRAGVVKETDPWTVWEKVPRETRDYLPSLLAVGYLRSIR